MDGRAKRRRSVHLVAAIAETNDCVIVTDNEKHFAGLEVLNPLRT
jgi:hypothetical protein